MIKPMTSASPTANPSTRQSSAAGSDCGIIFAR